MDPIQSWVDPDEVRRLAEGLIARPPKREEGREEAGYGAEWIGFAGTDRERPAQAAPARPATETAASPPEASVAVDARVQEQARQSLATARRIADQSGLLAPESPAQVAPRPAPPQEAPAPAPVAQAAPAAAATPTPAVSPFVERLQRYGAWLHQSFRATGFFVANREGEVLIDEVRSPKLLQVARTLAHASRTANRQAGGMAVGSLHIELGPDGILEVIPLTCRYGPLVLGLIVPECLPAQGVQAAAAGLQQVVDGTSPGPQAPRPPGGGAP